MIKRKPFIVEFTGTPEAGKTTVIKLVYKELANSGYKVKVYPESAENSPKFFPKECIEAKFWINFDTSKHVLEAHFQSEYDIIIFDRGAVDRIFFTYLDSIYNPDIVSKFYFFETILKDYPPDLLIAFYVSPDESIKRRGGEGRLVTKNFVSNYNNLFNSYIASLTINKVFIDTTNKSIEEVLKFTVHSILENKEKSHI